MSSSNAAKLKSISQSKLTQELVDGHLRSYLREGFIVFDEYGEASGIYSDNVWKRITSKRMLAITCPGCRHGKLFTDHFQWKGSERSKDYFEPKAAGEYALNYLERDRSTTK